MERLIAILDAHFIEIAIVGGVLIIGFFIYLTSTTEPMRSRVRGGVQGALISAVASFPIYTYIGRGNLAALAIIVIILCVSGQFLIEPLQKAIPKLMTRLLDRVEAFLDRLFGGGK